MSRQIFHIWVNNHRSKTKKIKIVDRRRFVFPEIENEPDNLTQEQHDQADRGVILLGVAIFTAIYGTMIVRCFL